jgi:hypothetical protein
VTPNPVTEMCKIEISFPGTATCQADVFDMNGKHVKSLFNGKIDTSLSLQWKPSGSGIYFLKVMTGGQLSVQKIVTAK